jgi:adenine-specific DNA methylase
MSERSIERGFPIVQLNPLSVRERNAFKPVYKMHKWFARRSSSIFRAVLLGAALPSEDAGRPIDLMEEFYQGHRGDPRLRRPDGAPLRVLDPFMGGGTTVVEALRLGFDAIGYDLNPIAWFIVRGETTPLDLVQFDAAAKRVADKVRDELLELYRTRCPLTGMDADIIYAFWVKQGVCIDPSCKGVTDLFKDYIVATKRGDATLKYVPDVVCTTCREPFDWELERCTITAGGPQLAGINAAGKGRPASTRYAFALPQDGVSCPSCGADVHGLEIATKKPKTKRVAVHVLIDPSTGDFFEVRGELPDEVVAPRSGHRFRPDGGPADGGAFECVHCGRKQEIVESARTSQHPLPFRYYGFYAHTPHCETDAIAAARLGLPTNNGKWYSPAREEDLQRVVNSQRELDRIRDRLPLPTQEIYDGYNTNRLVIHQYRRWLELYGPRQALSLGKLLSAISEEPVQRLREALLAAFQSTLNYQSWLCRYNIQRSQIEGVTSAHDYRNPTTIAESPPYGANEGIGRGTFVNYLSTVREGIAYLRQPDLLSPELESLPVDDARPEEWNCELHMGSAASLDAVSDRSIDLVITDPPYAGSVQYAEMSDWSYVWLQRALRDVFPDEFGSDVTLKAQEIVEDGAEKDAAHFFRELTAAWAECHRVLVDDGLLAFTFHHREGDRWTGLLRSLFDAGFYLVAAYPTHSEALNSIVIQATKGITYDIVHVCRKRIGMPEPIAWSRLRREVTRTAREQLREIEQGKDVLPGPDVQMILLGKALMLFSKHYGKVLDADGTPMDLDEAMERILVLVREVRGDELPLPGSLQNLDSLTQIALLHVVGKGPWSRDDLHKELRGYQHGPGALIDARLIREVKGQRAKLEAVPALERGSAGGLSVRREGPMVDKLHLLLATVSDGRSIEKLMKEWRGRWETITEALAWLAKVDASVKELANLTIRQIGTLGPDIGPQPITEQMDLFAVK